MKWESVVQHGWSTTESPTRAGAGREASQGRASAKSEPRYGEKMSEKT